MSVLVKGMEMPTSCKECRLLQEMDECYWCGCNSYLTFGDEDFVPDYVMNGCPLVPVPPHGRLIDADAKVQTQLYDDEHEEWVDVELTVDEYLGYCHNEVPTIIPASEEGQT